MNRTAVRVSTNSMSKKNLSDKSFFHFCIETNCVCFAH